MVEPENMYNNAEPPKSFINRNMPQMRHVVEPAIVKQVRDEIKADYECPFCEATRRADVFFRPDLSEGREVVIEIECRAYVKNEVTEVMEVCGNIETRYYNR